MCCTLLQCIDPTIKNQQKHCIGHLVIRWGVQYDCLLPEVARSHNHWVPLMDLKAGEVFPMVLVGDFALEDNIFPGTPGDSLLYTSKELDKLRRKGYQVAKHRLPALPAETSQPPQCSGEGNNSTHKGRELAKVADSPDKKSSCPQCSPPTKVCQESHDKDRSTSKHQEKSQKDKEDSRSLHKHMGSLVQESCITQVEKEPHLENPPLTFNTSSQSHQFNEMDDLLSLSGPADMSTPSKAGMARSHLQATSSDSRHSLTPSKPGAGNSFAFPNSSAFHHTSLTPAPSTSGSQHVTSSRWHPQVPLSPLHLQGLDPLTTDQAAALYKLATECQALGSDLAKRFCTLCTLDATHRAAAQSTVHEMVLSRCQAHSAAHGLATGTHSVPERELTLHGFCEAVNKAWKDANDILFSHLLQYNAELASFISSAEDALRNK